MRILWLLAFALLLSGGAVVAGDLTVSDAAITTAIVKQMPVDRVESYPADFGKLYCFTRVVGADDETKVTHVWYYRDQEMARVPLAIGSADWRTYSSKRFIPQWAGEWSVVVLDSTENVIATVPFRLE